MFRSVAQTQAQSSGGKAACSMVSQKLGAWKETSQGGRSKAREIPEPKRRACFKEDQAFRDVKFYKRRVELSIGLEAWRLLAAVKSTVSEDRGKESRLGGVTE